MIAAAVMLIMGFGDLVTEAKYLALREEDVTRRSWGDWVLTALAWLAAAGLLYSIAGAPLQAVATGAAAAVTGSLLLNGAKHGLPLAGCLLTLGTIAAAVIFDSSSASAQSPIGGLVAGAPQALGLTPTPLVLGIASIVFLGATSNTLVRAVLDVAGSNNPKPSAPIVADEIWQVQRKGRQLAAVIKAERRDKQTSFLGGRVVGPLERVIVFASLLSGLPVVIAGLVAAKGVVRFPEISADRDGGVKAEEFLVGTLCSLLLSGLAVLTVTTRFP